MEGNDPHSKHNGRRGVGQAQRSRTSGGRSGTLRNLERAEPTHDKATTGYSRIGKRAGERDQCATQQPINALSVNFFVDKLFTRLPGRVDPSISTRVLELPAVSGCQSMAKIWAPAQAGFRTHEALSSQNEA